ncbi:hypothetical protein N7471_010495 [Penicillium samsonianum]|uniref:uncharacterized protein n=1 Tax=Penicillium samsonianum TaxID=1882272 RepID=UPI0025474C0E|nr:uncharacterized protein N7471_010495 [Penicillium samsonianum]KAJ6126002.1 hypothetical protein N7471_010495 [Penicillium samsonianum]
MSGIERGPGTFASVRHFLGRLAHHIRASEELVEAAIDVSHMVQTFDVRVVNYTTPVPAPEPDGHTNLHDILNRMLPKASNESLIIERGLSDFNAVKGIF